MKNTNSIMYFCEIKKMNFSTLKPLEQNTPQTIKRKGKTSFAHTNTQHFLNSKERESFVTVEKVQGKTENVVLEENGRRKN